MFSRLRSRSGAGKALGTSLLYAIHQLFIYVYLRGRYLNSSLECLRLDRIRVPHTKFLHVCYFTSLTVDTPGCVTFNRVFCLQKYHRNVKNIVFQTICLTKTSPSLSEN